MISGAALPANRALPRKLVQALRAGSLDARTRIHYLSFRVIRPGVSILPVDRASDPLVSSAEAVSLAIRHQARSTTRT